MTGFLPIQEPGYRAAADKWIQSSLSDGLAISSAVASGLTLSAGAVYVLGDHQPPAESPEDFERGHNGSGAEAALAPFVSNVPSAKLLLVEDDLRLRTDPGMWGTAVFFGDTVVRWMHRPAESASEVPELLRRGASGFPLNAFLLRADSASLALSPGKGMPDDAVETIANEVCGIIVTAHDAEAYLAWIAEGVVAELATERSAV